uniref:NTR domain-containing protein n=1 Tax=Crocodylus porosus TaxID=8502 RepID=A0A7M4EKW2_CROPO
SQKAVYKPHINRPPATGVGVTEGGAGGVPCPCLIPSSLTAGDVGVQVGQRRWFLVRASCRLRLASGRRYLLMGQDGETHDPQGQPRYLLEESSWVEELPDARRCEATAHRSLCAQLRTFQEAYSQNGCKV